MLDKDDTRTISRIFNEKGCTYQEEMKKILENQDLIKNILLNCRKQEEKKVKLNP